MPRVSIRAPKMARKNESAPTVQGRRASVKKDLKSVPLYDAKAQAAIIAAFALFAAVGVAMGAWPS